MINTIEGYCVRCKKKRNIGHSESVVMKNGRNGIKGTCGFCGAKMFKLGDK